MVAIDWLLQAGFRIRGDATAIAVDPYLSDLCAQVYGLRRDSPAPVLAQDLKVDAVCVSHWHEDHLDIPTVLTVLRSGSAVIAPPSCLARIRGILSHRDDINPNLLRAIAAGETVAVGDAMVTAVPAVHAVPGYLTEDAVGFVVRLDGVAIYHSGDTDYSRSLLTAGPDLDVALVCVNGTGGNMNAIEAAALVGQLQPRIAVPMHFGLWAPDGYGPGATLDPQEFARLSHVLTPSTRVVVPSVSVPLELTIV